MITQMLHVWNIYLQNWAIFRVIVGKYSSTMEHLGFLKKETEAYRMVPPSYKLVYKPH
jgi:hypothetical protein